MIRITAQQFADRLLNRPPEYARELEPAIVSREGDGSIVFDETHPAWLAAKARYATLRRKPPRRADSCPFRTCASCTESAMCRIDGQPCEFGPGTFGQCTKQKPVTPSIPCSTCDRRQTCPIGHLSPCARKRAWAGDARYPIPQDCPAHPAKQGYSA